MWREIQRDRVIDGAAVLAFFFVLAIFPAVIVVLSLMPSLSIPHLREAMLDLLHQVLPQQSAEFFEVTFQYVSSEGKNGLLTFGLVFSLWSASSGVYAVIEQLDRIYGVKDRRPFWKARGTAILLMVFFVLLAVTSLSLAIFGGVVQSWAASIVGWSPALRLLFAAVRWIILVAALLLALAMAYRFGPDADLRFRFISPGNVTAAILISARLRRLSILCLRIRRLQRHIRQSRRRHHPHAVDVYGRRRPPRRLRDRCHHAPAQITNIEARRFQTVIPAPIAC